MAIVSRTTVRQVLDDIQIRLPHGYSTKTLFVWLNETMKKVYKDMAIQEFYSFTTSANRALYVLPENCSIDLISSVTMSCKAKSPDNLYDWGSFQELKSYLSGEMMVDSGFYDGTEGLIGIFPVPKDVRKIDIYYWKKPKMITSLDDYIELQDNYIDLVKFHVMSVIAMSGYNPDIELANEYILLYNNLVQQVNEAKNEQEQRYPIMRDMGKRKRRRS